MSWVDSLSSTEFGYLMFTLNDQSLNSHKPKVHVYVQVKNRVMRLSCVDEMTKPFNLHRWF